MVTYKLILDQRRIKSDGRYPISIRVTYNRKTKNVYTGISVTEQQWDSQSILIKKSCPGYKDLNRALTDKFLFIQKTILNLEEFETFSFHNLNQQINKPQKACVESITFLQFSNQIIQKLKDGNRTGNAIVYNTGVQRLIKYANNENLRFEDINYVLIDDFLKALQKQGIKMNSIGNYLRSIRAIFNIAIKSKIANRSSYPFADLSIKTERTAKRAILLSDLQKIYNSNYEANTGKWNARNYFLLSFCLRGISFTDLAYLTKANINNGRILYKRRKTSSQLNIQLLPLTSDILQLYRTSGRKYLLSILPNDIVKTAYRLRK